MIPARGHEGCFRLPQTPLSYAESFATSLQFGKAILNEQVPGWSQYYLDYKHLKKIISSLSSHRPATDAVAFTIGVPPRDLLATQSGEEIDEDQPLGPNDGPPILASLGQDDERGAAFQAVKAAFFFKLERELEKVSRLSCCLIFKLTSRQDQCFLPREGSGAKVAAGDLAVET